MTRRPERRSSFRALATIIFAVWLCGSGSLAQQAQEAEVDSADAAALDAAASVVSRLHDALVAAAALADVHERYEFLEDTIIATHDLEFIGRLTIRRQWRGLTEMQRSEFVDGFERLSVTSYAARFGNVSADSFAALQPETISGERVQVTSGVVRADDSVVPLEYVLQENESGWQIVNVIADGVSDVALKRAEYQALFEEVGFEALLEDLEEQTRALTSSEEN
jgi:phospholipid transport system substrate-binding protein